jgi:tRNA threonylcarbamoyl adenosine modification protein YeaZ
MLILALEGALAGCSACVWADGVVRAEAEVAGERGHPSVLPGLVERVLREAGVTAPSLDLVAVGVGPGGFTGLRTTLALAEGLALAAGVKLSGVTTGEALAAALTPAEAAGREVWCALDNKRGRLILERVGRRPEALDEADLPRPEGRVVLVGDAAPRAAARLAARGLPVLLGAPRRPRARDVAAVAASRPPRPAEPLYVEPPAVRG